MALIFCCLFLLLVLAANSLEGTYTFEELKEYFSFGVADIDINGNLTFSIINTFEEVRACLRFRA